MLYKIEIEAYRNGYLLRHTVPGTDECEELVFEDGDFPREKCPVKWKTDLLYALASCEFLDLQNSKHDEHRILIKCDNKKCKDPY